MTSAQSTLDPELIARVQSLSIEEKEILFEFAWGIDSDLPPQKQVDWPSEIQRRANEIHEGTARLLNREEFDQSIKNKLQELGLEL